jgi:serine/threonine-protein kinase
MISTLGRYKIISEIGQGAMGVVYKAVDPFIDRTVAIKTINLNLSKTELEEYEARFQQEIKAAGRLNHPNIVTIYDVGKTDQVAYMAMEYLEGVELKDMIATGQIPPADQVVDIIAQVADGLHFAHQQDIVHRDVKPSNIMVLKNNALAKITDFGIARLPNSAVKTMTGLILGSPRYMSPEQVIGKAIDSRSDIFSLGVVLYEALTGVAPFDGDNVNAIMYSTVNTSPQPPSAHNRAVPPMLDLIVAKAMAKLLEDRYQTVKEFGDDLREVRRQMDSSRPAAALKAMTAPPARSAPTPRAHEDTIPIIDAKAEEEAKPLSLAKTFDSFDATMRLMAQTGDIDEYKDYITQTQKMRAYRGKIEATSPLAKMAEKEAEPAAPAPAPAPKPQPAPERKIALRVAAQPGAEGGVAAGQQFQPHHDLGDPGAGSRRDRVAGRAGDPLTLQVVHRFGEPLDRDHLQARDRLLRLVGGGNDRVSEAELRGLAQPLLPALHGAHFPGETHFAEHHVLFGQRARAQAGDDGERDGEVRPGLRDANAADGIQEDILVVACDAPRAGAGPRAASRAGSARGPRRAAAAPCRATRPRAPAARPGAAAIPPASPSRTSRHAGVMLRQEERRRVGHLAKALLRHREDADLVHRAEAVLERADEAKARVRFALEIKDGIDHVLEDARAGERALLGDVADEDDGGPALLGQAREMRRAFAHLCHRSGRRGERAGIERLDGIDDGHARFRGRDRRLDLLQLDLGEKPHLGGVQAQAARAKRDLLCRLLSGHIENRHLLGKMRRGLQEKC